MANGRCRCQRCTIRGLTGPAVLITIGVLFLWQQSSWRFGFWKTWPVILLVIGLIKLAEALASTEGHLPSRTLGSLPPQPPLPPTPQPPAPPAPQPPAPPRLP
jgi:Domain of unknown function (DUF5668)